MLAYKVDRPDIESACRLRRNQQARAAADLTGQHNFLHVPARKRTHRLARRKAADIERLGHPFGIFSDSLAAQDTVL